MSSDPCFFPSRFPKTFTFSPCHWEKIYIQRRINIFPSLSPFHLYISGDKCNSARLSVLVCHLQCFIFFIVSLPRPFNSKFFAILFRNEFPIHSFFLTRAYIFASKSFAFFRSPQLPLTLKIVSLRLMTSHLMPGSLIYVLNLRVFSECPFLCRYYLVILRYFSFPMASLLYPSLPFPSPPFSSPRLASHPLFSPPLPLLSFHPLSPLPMRFEHDPLKTNKHRWKKTDRQISPYHFPCERTTATTITQLPVKERVKSLLEHKGKTRNEVNSVFSAQTL